MPHKFLFLIDSIHIIIHISHCLCMLTVSVVNVCSDSDEDTSEKSADEDSLKSTLEELTEVQFQFEVKAVRSSSSLCSHHDTAICHQWAQEPHILFKKIIQESIS